MATLRQRTARALLGLPRLLQGELGRIRLVPHGDAYLTAGIAAGMLFSLGAVHMFGYRRLPSTPVAGTAATARQVLLTASRAHAAAPGRQQESLYPDRGEPDMNEKLDVGE